MEQRLVLEGVVAEPESVQVLEVEGVRHHFRSAVAFRNCCCSSRLSNVAQLSRKSRDNENWLNKYGSI